ncbi:hypothetical protein NKR23_g2220 [Pleurostoma richardsiae]|uniref:Uncharacterized protein n=1 Tax=Pleurostoma richardsiae TaxID=41990 RepID=A0AA38VNC3_9PEZI|nr:hypothetical protein NKR23_g2220 [Pleurostoma richardsiae]
MKGIMRPSRGRPNKVVKPSSAPRRPGRPIDAAQFEQYQEGDGGAAAAEQRDDAAEEAGQHTAEDELPGGPADAAGHVDVDPDMEQPADEPIDLNAVNAAANILANGGVSTVAAGPSATIYPDVSDAHSVPVVASASPGAMPPAPMSYPAPPEPQQHQPQQHLHAQQQQQQHDFTTTEDMARDSGYTEFKIDSAFAKRLSREPGQRHADQRKPDQHLNMVRRSNVEALFAQIAGDLAPSPCHHCRKGQGPWTQCVLYGGQMMGSCANCWFNASGSRCSFHEKSNPPPPLYHTHVTAPLIAAEPGGAYPVPAIPLAPHGTEPSTPGQAVPLGAYHIPAYSDDPNVRYTVEKAIADVRRADRSTRHLMKIEIKAKQLALEIVEYEEAVQQQQQHQQHQQQQQQQQHQPEHEL